MNRLFSVRESGSTLAVLRLGVGLLIALDTATSWRYSIELYSRSGPAMPFFATPPDSLLARQVIAAARAPTTPAEILAPAGEQQPTSTSPAPGHLPTPVTTPSPMGPAPAPAIDSSDRSPEAWRGPWWPDPPAGVAVAAQSLLLFAALSLAGGWQTGCSLSLCGLLLAWLRPLDLSWTFAKPTVAWLHMLLLLGLGECGGSPRLFQPASPQPADEGSGLARWLLRLLACQIYAGAALTKLQSGWFPSGELLQYSLLDRQYGGTAWGQWLAATPGLTRPLSLATLVFEIVFPVLVWVPQCRRWMLMLAVLFHLSVGACLHVALFTPTMLVLLLAFIEPGEWRWLTERWNGWRGREEAKPERAAGGDMAGALGATRSKGWRSAGLWVAGGVVAMGLGVAVQWGADWYGVFGRREPPAPVEVSRAVLGELTRQAEPPADWPVHRVALGTRQSPTGTWGDPERARRGESIFVRVQYSVPHRPLMLSGVLLGDDGQELARFEHQVRDEVSHSLDGFALDDTLPPGGGRVLLLIDGEELTSRAVRWDP